MNWLEIKHNWFHLSEISFPQLAKRGMICVLLGADNHKLTTTIKEVPGKVNKWSARLCLLGWTAIGRTHKEDLRGENHTRFIRTFHMQQLQGLRDFWEPEHIRILSSSIVGKGRQIENLLRGNSTK